MIRILQPIYNIWKKKKDKVYYNLTPDEIKRDWISTQHNIHSSIAMPLILFMINIGAIVVFWSLDVALKANIDHIFGIPIQYLFLPYFAFFLAVILCLTILGYFNDEYCDEKYFEMARSKKT